MTINQIQKGSLNGERIKMIGKEILGIITKSGHTIRVELKSYSDFNRVVQNSYYLLVDNKETLQTKNLSEAEDKAFKVAAEIESFQIAI